MANTLLDPKVATVLDRLYAKAESQIPFLRSGALQAKLAPSASAQEAADVFDEIYMAVTPATGRLLYSLVRAARPAVVVEFGMSFGISALHLAAAARDNGFGRVVTTELSEKKIEASRAVFAETGLDDLIAILEGDATQTLADLAGPVDFVLLDGWKDLYLPVLQLLEPLLAPGALVVADNTGLPGLEPYLEHVRDSANGYVSSNFVVRGEDGIEISCRAG
ncbi:MAG: O-methyltransferase [Segniliparus sp.]|uniref:O-methyltransferase n=1 Tax=Segniliparus sp. TaxID=2804064 RepID=UPI003F375422